jgi:hypothetical protein
MESFATASFETEPLGPEKTNDGQWARRLDPLQVSVHFHGTGDPQSTPRARADPKLADIFENFI